MVASSETQHGKMASSSRNQTLTRVIKPDLEDRSNSDDDIYIPDTPVRISATFAPTCNGVSRTGSDDIAPERTQPTQTQLEPQPATSGESTLTTVLPENEASGAESVPAPRRPRENSTSSIVDGLLCEIYDRWHYSYRDSFDSDTFTEYSSTSDVFYHGRSDSVSLVHSEQAPRFNRSSLLCKGVRELHRIRAELQHRSAQLSARLIRQLKSRDRRLVKRYKSYDIVTAILQASSLKRRQDSKIRFSLEPVAGDDAFQQWKDAMRAVARLPSGVPAEFRKTVWLSLADGHINSLKVCWDKTCKFAFNDRSNPDDNKLGLQIVKDLHRTGCSGFSGEDNEEERAILKRVLLAYARWNKQVGYCQGFNVLVALILEVTERREDQALEVMIYLVDHLLPESYFANNLRALSVDMAVFRDLLRMQLPNLSRHLDHLQASARDDTTGANYEPPLTNVFTMQWFLTLFATCLPKATALRVWDSVMLEGSEVLLRTAVAIWERLENRILAVNSADDFYTTMGSLTQEMLDSDLINPDDLIKRIYSMAPFPYPQLSELREKYTYNITPFSAAMSTGRKPKSMTSVFSDDDDLDDEDIVDNVNCFTGMFPPTLGSPSKTKLTGETDQSLSGSNRDVSRLSPGAYGAQQESQMAAGENPFSERMSTDLDSLCKQYRRLRERQKQAHIILATASAKHHANMHSNAKPVLTSSVAHIESPVAVNHLFIGRKALLNKKNKTIAEAPKIAPFFTAKNLLSNQQPLGNYRKSKDQKVLYGVLRKSSVTDSTAGKPCSSDGSTCDVESDYTCVESDTDIASLVEDDGSVIEEPESQGSSPSKSSSTEDVPGEIESDKTESETDSPPIPSCTISDETTDGDCSLIEEVSNATRPNLLQLSPPGGACDRAPSPQNLALTPSSPQQGIEDTLSRTPSPIHSSEHSGVLTTDKTPEYIAHLTYKAYKNNHIQKAASSPESMATTSNKKVFNPFTSQQISKRRLENGIRLGLYSANAVPKVDGVGDKWAGNASVARQSMNTSVHRHYMTDMKHNTATSRR